MSQFCKTELCNTVQAVVDVVTSSNDTTDLLFTSVAVDKSESTNRSSKSTPEKFPDASLVPDGHILYLDDAKVPVISINGSWVGFDGRVASTFNENELWVWGSGQCGVLGIGNTINQCSPVREFCSATDWCQVSGGGTLISAIKTSGELWAWGLGTCGRLGDGTTINKCSPIREICSATDWCQVSSGTFGASAIKTSGELWAWGGNRCGLLGDGTITDKCSPIREFCSATDWCQVSSYSASSSAVKTGGQLWSWGRNQCGLLGAGTTADSCSPVREFCSATDWCQVSVNGYNFSAIKTSGELWSWGQNFCGQLGDGKSVCTTCSPVREMCSATDWCQVATTTRAAMAIKTSGELWSWGSNNCGRLGDGTLTSRCSPVQEFCSATDWCQVSAGSSTVAAIKTSGQLWSWGVGACGRLANGTLIDSCSPVREICSETDWCQVSSGTAQAAINLKTFVCR